MGNIRTYSFLSVICRTVLAIWVRFGQYYSVFTSSYVRIVNSLMCEYVLTFVHLPLSACILGAFWAILDPIHIDVRWGCNFSVGPMGHHFHTFA